MAGQEQVNKQEQTSTQETEQVEEVEAKDLQNEALSQETDDILDAIDEILEENAQEFVEGFVQKGGQ